jgi:hypothetical protein
VFVCVCVSERETHTHLTPGSDHEEGDRELRALSELCKTTQILKSQRPAYLLYKVTNIVTIENVCLELCAPRETLSMRLPRCTCTEPPGALGKILKSQKRMALTAHTKNGPLESRLLRICAQEAAIDAAGAGGA